MTPTISSLLSRVRAASGPDRELDAEIAALIGYREPHYDCLWSEFKEKFPKATPWSEIPRWSASIDAAVALVERVGYAVHTIHRSKSGLWSVTLEPNGESEGLRLLPLAILAALLSALDQKEST